MTCHIKVLNYMMLICYKCKRKYPADSFVDGSLLCEKCTEQYHKQFNARHPDEITPLVLSRKNTRQTVD